MPPRAPKLLLTAHRLDQRLRLHRTALRRALNEAAAEHARLSGGRVIEHTGLARRDTFFAGYELDLVTAVSAAQPSGLRRARRTHPHENLETPANRAIDLAIADPVDVAELNAIHPQRFARADHDAARRGIEPHDKQRRAGGDAEPSPLADREMRNALMPAQHAAVEIDDIARLKRVRPQAADDIGIAAGRHEADILAVVLVSNRQPKPPRQLPHLTLGHITERKAQMIELLTRRRKQEIALIAVGVGRADQRARTVGKSARGDIVARRKHLCAKLARGLEQIAKLDRAIALNARDRRFAGGVALGKGIDHRFPKTLLVIEHVVRNPDSLRDVARIVDILACTAGALAMGRGAMVVKLQRDADNVIALRLQQRSRRRRIDAAGHGDDDPGVLRTAFEFKTVKHRV